MTFSCSRASRELALRKRFALKQSLITFKVSPAARLFVCAIEHRINNTRVFSVSLYRFLLIFERFLTDSFPYVLFAFVKLREISFRSKLVQCAGTTICNISFKLAIWYLFMNIANTSIQEVSNKSSAWQY